MLNNHPVRPKGYAEAIFAIKACLLALAIYVTVSLSVHLLSWFLSLRLVPISLPNNYALVLFNNQEFIIAPPFGAEGPSVSDEIAIDMHVVALNTDGPFIFGRRVPPGTAYRTASNSADHFIIDTRTGEITEGLTRSELRAILAQHGVQQFDLIDAFSYRSKHTGLLR